MKKGSIQADIAETLAELGKSTATQSVKAVGQTLNPLTYTEKIIAKNQPGQENVDQLTGEKITKENVPNSTKLDVKKIQDKYKNQDDVQLGNMRNRLFKLVKEGEEKAIADLKREEEDRKKKELMELEEKKKKQQQATHQPDDIPHGKERRSIFAVHKKKAMEQHVETKPQVSKG